MLYKELHASHMKACVISFDHMVLHDVEEMGAP